MLYLFPSLAQEVGFHFVLKEVSTCLPTSQNISMDVAPFILHSTVAFFASLGATEGMCLPLLCDCFLRVLVVFRKNKKHIQSLLSPAIVPIINIGTPNIIAS